MVWSLPLMWQDRRCIADLNGCKQAADAENQDGDHHCQKNDFTPGARSADHFIIHHPRLFSCGEEPVMRIPLHQSGVCPVPEHR